MIENDKQLQITKTHLENFESELSLLQNGSDIGDGLQGVHPLLIEVCISALKAKIEEFKVEIDEYTNK